MQITVDLPEDIHRLVQAIARDSHSSLSETIARLLQAALASPGPLRSRRARAPAFRSRPSVRW